MRSIIYLYKNLIDVQLSEDYHKERNRVVYTRDINLYKDTDNELYFQFNNPDQKRISITGKEFTFFMFDESEKEDIVLVELPIIIVDGLHGEAKVIIPTNLLASVKLGKYNYSIQTISAEGLQQAAYVDDNYGIRGVINVMSGPRPIFRGSDILTFDEFSHLTDVVGEITSLHQNTALHTAVLKFAGDPDDVNVIGFTGVLTVQATMDNTTNQLVDLNFFDVATADITEQEEPITLNFNGIFSGVRFMVATISGEITEVQYRY